MKVLLFSIIFFLCSCSPLMWWRAGEIAINNYPSDNIIEEAVEERIEEWMDAPEGSIDLSIFSPEGV